MKGKKIIYVNFAPYDNAGRILDFLIDNFDIVIHFSYDHLRLKKGKRSSLAVYVKGDLIYQKNLLWLRTHPLLLFPSLPFVALAILFQTLYYSLKYKEQYGRIDYFLTVNAFSVFVGNIIRNLGVVKKTIYWVWDYFPPKFPDWRLRIARWVYWKFDKPSRNNVDKVIYLNNKLLQTRMGMKSRERKKTLIVPIGTNPSIKPKFKHSEKLVVIGHLGMLKSGQGLDLLFDSLPTLIKKFPKIRIEIIGSGPEEWHYRSRAKRFTKNIKFYGFIENDNDVDKIMSRWSIGIATYLPVEWSEHYWTDPSKIKAYLNQAVPVITTHVPEFSNEVKKYKAGLITEYNRESLLQAIEKLIKHNQYYSKNAYRLSKKYIYSSLYPKLFEKL